MRPYRPSVLLAFLAVLLAGVQGNFQLCEHRGHDRSHLSVAQDHDHAHACEFHDSHEEHASHADPGPACVDHRAVDVEPWSLPPATAVPTPALAPATWSVAPPHPSVRVRERAPAPAPRARPPPRPGPTAPLLI